MDKSLRTINRYPRKIDSNGLLTAQSAWKVWQQEGQSARRGELSSIHRKNMDPIGVALENDTECD